MTEEPSVDINYDESSSKSSQDTHIYVENAIEYEHDISKFNKCKLCCGSCVYDVFFMDNTTQFSCMLFYGLIPICIFFVIGIITGSILITRYSDQYYIGICVILGSLALCCFIYAGIALYIKHYRQMYSPNIGSHGYFPFL